MTFDPIAANLAVELTRRHLGSAHPDAPVVPFQPARPTRIAAARLRVAGSLRAAAGWVEPNPANVCQPS
ncbi:MAG TPA: hypothetical protein VFI19_17995 [Nocardioides sp.]|jgi:hypothetical protein|nr:hypothetical protein [Nocardioides sp.]